MANSVAIVLVNWNGISDTLACLSSLLGLSYKNFNIFLVDNNSKEQISDTIVNWSNKYEISLTTIKEQDLKKVMCSGGFEPSVLNFLELQNNYGFAGGNNKAIELILLADCFDYVWLLNNDTEVDLNALTALIQREKESAQPSIVGSRLVYHHDRDLIQAYGGCSYNKYTGIAKTIGNFDKFDETVNVSQVEDSLDYIIGASFFMPIQFVKEIGLMCDDYFLYFEEIDWCTRAGDNYSLSYAHDSIVYHKEGASIGSSSTPNKVSLLSEYYLFKNKLLFTKKHYPLYFPIVVLASLLQAINRLRRKEIEKFKNIMAVVFGKQISRFESIRNL